MTLFNHMDRASRSQRLRETLEGMGLFVIPVYREGAEEIDHLRVSVDLPQAVADGASSTPVAAPVPSSEVGPVVGSTECNGANVVNFPPVLR